MFSSIRRFLNARRLFAYCGATLFVFQACVLVAVAADNLKHKGHPSCFDFQTFWAASHLALEGTPLKAYDWQAILDTTRQFISPHYERPGPWFYPPNFLLVVKPFALIPSPAASLIFAAITALTFVLLARRVVRLPDSLIWILAFPGIWLNAMQGQNAALTASLAFGALLAMRTRPVLAGVLIGLLSIKPHLAILFPVALACAGMWTAFIAAGVTVCVFTAISVAYFGIDIVPAFLHGLSDANTFVADGRLPWDQMASLFATLRMMHVPAFAAYVAQAVQATFAVAALAWVWRNERSLPVRAAALVGGTFLVSPYIYNYDCVWLGIPVALMTAAAARDGWLRGERLMLGIVWLYPAIGNPLENHLKLGVGPLVCMLLLVIAIRRTRRAMGVARGMDMTQGALAGEARAGT